MVCDPNDVTCPAWAAPSRQKGDQRLPRAGSYGGTGGGRGEGADDGLGHGVLLDMTKVVGSDCGDNCTTLSILMLLILFSPRRS